MSRRTRTRFQRLAAVSSLAVMGSVVVGAGIADAGEGPVCSDDEAPVCEEPRTPPRINVVSPTAPGYLTMRGDLGLTAS